MSDAQLLRPRYFQGEYLGPEDLTAAVDHARWARARHDLGAHAWGIAAGLALREVPALEGGVDVFVEPGYAVDGFGRPLSVAMPTAVPLDRLQGLNVAAAAGQSSVLVAVGLRYAESGTAEPPYGFESCESDDAFARTAEGVEIEVGAFAADEQRDKVVVAAEEMDAILALRTADDEAPLLRDASVPFQAFPDSPDRWWLVPLGVVRWDPAAGQLQETTADDRRESRRLRRYLGVVAEGVWAAGDLIRLRSRLAVPGAGQGNDEAVADERPLATGELDMEYDKITGRVTFKELVWIEGSLRLVGDGRLFGGKLELRKTDGEDGDVPMQVRRVETNGFLNEGGKKGFEGKDLEILVGTVDDTDGRNRLVIGVTSDDPDDVLGRVVVQNDGRVGIGTLDPPTGLASPLTIRAIGGGEELLSFERADGTGRKWHVNQLPGGANGLSFNETGVLDGRLFLGAGGKVGIGTTAPEATVDVVGTGATVGGKWLRMGDGADSGRFWVEYGAQSAPLMVLSDQDDPPRLRFQQIGTGSEDAPQFSSWIGHARASSSALAVMDGFLGVGTTDPQVRLHVDGGTDVDPGNPSSGFLVLGGVSGENLALDNNEIAARNNGALAPLYLNADGGGLQVHSHLADAQRFVVTSAGRVGMGTSAPTDTLDVRGTIKLGNLGELFAVSGVLNQRVVAGFVGVTFGVFAGPGFTGSWTGTGVATVNFDVPFAAPPVVVATTVNAPGDDQIVYVSSMLAGSFQVVTADVERNVDEDVGERQNTQFTFIAIGTR
jgi:hypothetical protein